MPYRRCLLVAWPLLASPRHLLPKLGKTSVSKLPVGNFQRTVACKDGLAFQHFFDADQLVVLGCAIRPRQRAGFNLTTIGGHCQIGNRCSLQSLPTDATSQRYSHYGVRFRPHPSVSDRCANLIDLNQDGIGQTITNALLQARGIGHKQIIANQLAFFAQKLR
jgi:hypothetical protein